MNQYQVTRTDILIFTALQTELSRLVNNLNLNEPVAAINDILDRYSFRERVFQNHLEDVRKVVLSGFIVNLQEVQRLLERTTALVNIMPLLGFMCRPLDKLVYGTNYTWRHLVEKQNFPMIGEGNGVKHYWNASYFRDLLTTDTHVFVVYSSANVFELYALLVANVKVNNPMLREIFDDIQALEAESV